jgi:acetone carboxylase alpha subunit
MKKDNLKTITESKSVQELNLVPDSSDGTTERKSLLASGLTLKEHRDGVLLRTKQTGKYNGIATLDLKENDPIRYEKLFSKLRGGLVHSRETAKKIAASPIVEQEGELCFTLYNAAGDCVLTSTGLIFHVGRQSWNQSWRHVH